MKGAFIFLAVLFIVVPSAKERKSLAYSKMGDATMMKGLKNAIDKAALGLRNKRVRLNAEFLGYAGTKKERDYIDALTREIAGYLKEKYNIELISFVPLFQEDGKGKAPPRVNINFILDERLTFPTKIAKSDDKPSSKAVAQYNREGAQYFKEGKLDDAILRFDKALELEPENEDVLFNRAVVLHKKGRVDVAESEYLKLLREEESLRVQLMLGILYQEKGEPDRAADLYVKVLEKSPGNTLAKKRLSQLRPGMKAEESNSSMALALSEKRQRRLKKPLAKRKAPLTEKELKSHAHNRAGIEAYLRGDYAMAFGEFIDAVITDPNNVQARFNLGVAYQLRERYGEAIVEFQKVLQLGDVPRAHVMLGATYVMQGRYRDAVEELRDVVFFDFDSWKVSPDGTRAIGEFVKIMKGTGGDSPLRLDGHSDSIGSIEYNADLSKKRAIAVALEMVVMNRLNPDAIFISGRGEGDPAATNRTVAGRRLNRRVEMIVPAAGALR